MPGEVSDQEIERELATLRNLRRRSVTSAGPGALAVDPDLPPPAPESSTSYSSNDDITLSTPDGLDGESAGLFWVPAHLHPELAPGEFRAFLKSHTVDDPTNADASDAGEAAGLSRSSSWLSRNPSRRGNEGLGRKRSMLSRQYQPKVGDDAEEDRPPLPSRRPLSIYGGRSGEKGLTLQDLQMLEEIVDEAGEDDPENMRKMLRRSLSTNRAPGFLHDDIPQGDDGDSSIIPPRPGSILRRSARTKIRKAGLAGDGGGHRFAATRKGRMTAAPHREIPGLEDDDFPDGYHHGGSDEGASAESQEHEAEEIFHDAPQHLEERRGSDASTDETNIFDAYARNSRSSSVSSESRTPSESPSPDSSPPGRKLSLPPIVSNASEEGDWFASDAQRTPTQETVNDPLAGVRRPSPGSEFSERPAIPLLSSGPSLQVPQDPLGPRPGSPSTPQQRQYDLPPGMAPPAQRAAVPPGIAMQQQQQQQPQQPAQTIVPVDLGRPALTRVDSAQSTTSSAGSKEKEKKGGFFSKKDKKDKEGKAKKEKDRFLGSLFGGSKKKQEDISSVASFSAAGPATAAALLGSSRSAKALGAPPSPSPTAGFSSFARYPIHVERAVYRLSHIKLANARRPLYEQVLISNLMFWYLGVIGRNVTEEKKAGSGSTNPEDKKDETKVVIKGTPPRPADSGSAGKIDRASRPPLAPIETSAAAQASPASVASSNSASGSPVSPISGKKTSLSKPERARDGRKNEAPMRAPQYGMQNAQVDHELRSGGAPQMRPMPMQHQQRPPSGQGQGPGQGPPHPIQQQHQQHPPQGYGGPPQPNMPQQQFRPGPNGAASPKAPPRTLSPPSNGPGPGQGLNPAFPHGPHQGVRGPPGGVPQSSFGPPPSTNGPGPAPNGDLRQRTMSNPTPPPGPSTAGMRRVVTDGRVPPDGPNGIPGPATGPGPGGARPLHAQHSGPQPGQIFRHPSASVSGGQGPQSPFQQRPSPPPSNGPQPGQIFSLGQQPGQIFRPPQQQNPHPQQHQHHPQQQQQYGQRPLPPPGQGPPHPHQPQANGWQPPQRLPPGASPAPGIGQPQQHQQQWQGPPRPQGQGQGYDPRRGPLPQPGQGQQGQGQQAPYSPLQAFYSGSPQRPPASSGVSGNGHGPASTRPQPGEIYGGYPANAGYGHHR